LGFKGDHPLFIFGESYAGKYAPAIAEKIKR
jgi:carboxypeptidase C (cathepsin A)